MSVDASISQAVARQEGADTWGTTWGALSNRPTRWVDLAKRGGTWNDPRTSSPTWADLERRNLVTPEPPESSHTLLQSAPSETLPATIPGSRSERNETLSVRETRQQLGPDFLRVKGMQKWEGRILSIGDGDFEAELTPLDHEGPTLIADFDLELLVQDSDDEPQTGDMFYMTVRTVRSRGALTTKTAALRLRRLGRWQDDEAAHSESAAKRMVSEFGQYAD